MKKLNSTKELVRKILIAEPSTRNNDSLLYCKVIEHLGNYALYMPFENVLLNLKEYGLPNIETVGRCRRKLQREFPELSANSTVEGFRAIKEAEFKEFSRGGA